MNTLGEKNGAITVDVDGVRVLTQRGIEFRTTRTFAIDTFGIFTFAGGSTADFAPAEPMYIDFDTIRVQRR